MNNNKSFRDRLWMIIVTFFALGAPAAGGFAFKITQDSRKVLVVMVFYVITGFIFGFASKVWSYLEDPMAQNLAEFLKRSARNILSYQNRRKYLRHLRIMHQNIDLRGLKTGAYSLELRQIFIELKIIPSPAHLATANPILPITDDLYQKSKTIWEYLQTRQMLNLVIIGPPGSGKTTLLQNITLVLASNRKLHRHINRPNKLPVLISLRKHSTIINNKKPSLVEVISSTVPENLTIRKEWFNDQLVHGHCLIMLDGLDEVASQFHLQTVNWVQKQMVKYPRNRYLITSRPHGYRDNFLRRVTILEVQSFSYEQVKQFVVNWYLIYEKLNYDQDNNVHDVQRTANNKARDLLRRLQNMPALLELAINPLLLTMITEIHSNFRALPKRRAELYADIFEVFLGKRKEKQGIKQKLTPNQKQMVLQPLAYHMMTYNQNELDVYTASEIISKPLQKLSWENEPEDFLKFVQDSSGLLLEVESGSYSFAHLTLQEFLAATYVKENKLENELIAKLPKSEWHETIRLYCAQTDATSVIRSCLVDNKPTISILTLAIGCLEEAYRVQDVTRNQLETLLEKGLEDKDHERRRLIAETLLSLRLRRMRRLRGDKYVDNRLITHAEYQLFLDEERVDGRFYQPDHWESLQFSLGKGRDPIVGVRSSDVQAFCDWLTAREAGLWHYRPLHLNENRMELISENAYWVTSQNKDEWLIEGGTSSRFSSRNIQTLLQKGAIRDILLIQDGAIEFNRLPNLERTITAVQAKRDALIADIGINYTQIGIVDANIGWALDFTSIYTKLHKLVQNYNHCKSIPQLLLPYDCHTLIQNLIVNFDFANKGHIYDPGHKLIYNEVCKQIKGCKVTAKLDLEQAYKMSVDRNLVYDNNRIQAIVQTLDNNLILIDELRNEWLEVIRVLRKYVRFVTLLTAIELTIYQEQLGAKSRRIKIIHNLTNHGDPTQKLLDNILDIYVNCIILEERIKRHYKGTMNSRKSAGDEEQLLLRWIATPFEGIRIVKERKY